MLILIFFWGILHQEKRYFYLCKIRIREDVFVFHTIASLYWDPWHGVLGLSIVVSLALEALFGSLKTANWSSTFLTILSEAPLQLICTFVYTRKNYRHIMFTLSMNLCSKVTALQY